CVTGFVGAGGGFIIVPSLVLLLHVPMKRAVGTSLAIIAANSFFGFTITLKNHQFDWRLLLTIAGLGVLGMVIGQRLSSRVSDMGLRKGFGYFVLAVGLFLLIDQGLSIFVA